MGVGEILGEELRSKHNDKENRITALHQTIHLSLESVAGEERDGVKELFHTLALSPEDTIFSEDTIQLLWNSQHGTPTQADETTTWIGCCFPTHTNQVGVMDSRWTSISRVRLGEFLHILVNRSLLIRSVDQGGVRVHDMVKQRP